MIPKVCTSIYPNYSLQHSVTSAPSQACLIGILLLTHLSYHAATCILLLSVFHIWSVILVATCSHRFEYVSFCMIFVIFFYIWICVLLTHARIHIKCSNIMTILVVYSYKLGRYLIPDTHSSCTLPWECMKFVKMQL